MSGAVLELLAIEPLDIADRPFVRRPPAAGGLSQPDPRLDVERLVAGQVLQRGDRAPGLAGEQLSAAAEKRQCVVRVERPRRVQQGIDVRLLAGAQPGRRGDDCGCLAGVLRLVDPQCEPGAGEQRHDQGPCADGHPQMMADLIA